MSKTNLVGSFRVAQSKDSTLRKTGAATKTAAAKPKPISQPFNDDWEEF